MYTQSQNGKEKKQSEQKEQKELRDIETVRHIQLEYIWQQIKEQTARTFCS